MSDEPVDANADEGTGTQNDDHYPSNQQPDASEDQTVRREEGSGSDPGRWPVLGIAFAVLWLFVRGVELTDHGHLALGYVLGEFLIGLTVGIPIAYLFRRFYSPTPVIVRTPRAMVAGLQYTTHFLYELVTANVDVARRVLSPRMPIDPAVIEVPLRVETDLAITTIANSITLTPGTLTMDYDTDQNSLYVHTLAATDPETVIEPIRSWEDYALVMFNERLDPGSPVPEYRQLDHDTRGSSGRVDGDDTDTTPAGSDVEERGGAADE